MLEKLDIHDLALVSDPKLLEGHSHAFPRQVAHDRSSRTTLRGCIRIYLAYICDDFVIISCDLYLVKIFYLVIIFYLLSFLIYVRYMVFRVLYIVAYQERTQAVEFDCLYQP